MFRLLHLTDLHLCIEPSRSNIASLRSLSRHDLVDVLRTGADYGLNALFHPASYKPAALQALIRFVNENADSYDLLAISGDLITTGRGDDLAVGQQFLVGNAMYAASGYAPGLDSRGTPIVAVPGNHDRYQDVKATPGSPNFELRFGNKFMPGYSGRTGWLALSDASGSEALLFLYADFSFLSANDPVNKAHRYGGGNADQHTRRNLENATWKLRRRLLEKFKSVQTVWMIHFAPYECGAPHELIDKEQVIELASHCNVRTMICGHTHRMRKYDELGVTVFCGGAATSVGGENYIHELEISGPEVNWSHYKWSQYDGEFLPFVVTA